jgi:hypothetical protein
MQKQLLLPRKCRLIGYILLPFALTFLIAAYCYDYSISFLHYHPENESKNTGLFGPEFLFSKNFYADFTGTIAIILTFVALFMIAFSRLKNEDEYVSHIRLSALQTSVYANYFILLLSALLMFGGHFLMIMEINLFTILILFILIFNYSIYLKPRLSKS